MQRDTEQAVAAFNNESALVKEGYTLVENTAVENTADIFSNILEKTTNVSQRVQEVSAFIEEIAAENEEVVAVFEQLTSTSHENAMSLNEIKTAVQHQKQSFDGIVTSTKQMQQLIEDLNNLVTNH